ncbi:MAG TPA: hypothetical protein VJT71_14240 [Pyrinomonadaceae bacterium]|nr:hypothetical protein [Pyrinomonadaceae bacterium]
MNDEQTKDLKGKKSFEERVFGRFDAMDQRLEKLEARSYDTKPIWEQAVKAIMDLSKEVVVIRSDLGVVKSRTAVIESAIAGLTNDVNDLKTDVGELKTDVGELKTDVGELKTDVGELKTNVGELKTHVGELKVGYGRITNELVDIRREVRENIRRELSHILKTMIEDRQDIRDAENRIRNLETKLA